MSISTVTTTIKPEAIYDLLGLPAHLRPGGECWPFAPWAPGRT